MLGQFKAGLVFLLQSMSICHFSESHVEIIFTENDMKQKRTDGESAKAVTEQGFLSRYKSEPDSGVFCFQIFCILPVLSLLSLVYG